MKTAEDTVYIDFRNKDNNFKTDRKYFKTYDKAKKWAIENFESFNPDFINYV